MATTTLLFADQVGSTEQLRLLGDVATRILRIALVESLVLATEAHGGTVVDLTGDGLFARFSSAVDALDAASEMQAAVGFANRTRPEPSHLRLRVGVHTGEPIEGNDGSLFGLAVVVARRLCDRAGDREVLVSDLTRSLVDSRQRYAFASSGPQELKGIEQPVMAWRLGVDPLFPTGGPEDAEDVNGTDGSDGGDGGAVAVAVAPRQGGAVSDGPANGAVERVFSVGDLPHGGHPGRGGPGGSGSGSGGPGSGGPGSGGPGSGGAGSGGAGSGGAGSGGPGSGRGGRDRRWLTVVPSGLQVAWADVVDAVRHPIAEQRRGGRLAVVAGHPRDVSVVLEAFRAGAVASAGEIVDVVSARMSEPEAEPVPQPAGPTSAPDPGTDDPIPTPSRVTVAMVVPPPSDEPLQSLEGVASITDQLASWATQRLTVTASRLLALDVPIESDAESRRRAPGASAATSAWPETAPASSVVTGLAPFAAVARRVPTAVVAGGLSLSFADTSLLASLAHLDGVLVIVTTDDEGRLASSPIAALLARADHFVAIGALPGSTTEQHPLPELTTRFLGGLQPPSPVGASSDEPTRLVRSAPASLQLADGGGVPVWPDGVVIGRGHEAGVRVDDPDVSRRHVRVSAPAGQWIVEDLGSTNGTRVNGTVVREHYLRNGDEIVIGNTVLRFVLA